MNTPKLWRDYIPSYKRKANNFKKSIDKANEVYLKLIRDRKQEIDRIPIDEQLNSDALTMLLTVNTPRDITTRISDNNHTRPMSEEEILGNVFEIISGGVDSVLLRMMSVVPIIFRMSHRDDKISGHQFSGQTQFMLNTYGIHHNKEHWINPEVFNPSPFGGGSRMCPGKQLAMTIIKTLMVLLYRKYDVRLSDMNAPIKYHFSILRHCDDLNVILKPIFQDL
ncbi:281_t:CDS:2 [Diversispora eburnea]|uniref:281_t:CDS:1 n=1 Tax=Diversispora eburnea TaxID=1213867 RepID=A0A9N8YYH2_9GLOM|nr:281_t:CDS:2 [Diversispora eburnea]